MNLFHTFIFYLFQISCDIISSLTLSTGVPNGFFSSGFLTSNVYAFLFSPNDETCPTHLSLCDYPINYGAPDCIIFSSATQR
jgi:hypothetical protein